MFTLKYLLVFCALVFETSTATNETFILANTTECAAQISTKTAELIVFDFINGTCTNPKLWLEFNAIYLQTPISVPSYTYLEILGLPIVCNTSNSLNCSDHISCVENFSLPETNPIIIDLFKSEYEGSPCTYTTDNYIFITILCGFPAGLTIKQLDNISLCNSTIKTNATNDMPIPVYFITMSDNWVYWTMLGSICLLFIFIFFTTMWNKFTLKFSLQFCSVIFCLSSAMSISTIISSLISTVIIHNNESLEFCENFESQAKKNIGGIYGDQSLQTIYVFYILSLVVSTIIYMGVLYFKILIHTASAHEHYMKTASDDDSDSKCKCACKCNYKCECKMKKILVKFMLFIVLLSFSAICRPLYEIGHFENDPNTNCKVVGDYIALIAELFGTAIISCIITPIAGYLTYCCADIDCEGVCGFCIQGIFLFTFGLYTVTGVVIVIATPFVMIFFRCMEEYNRVNSVTYYLFDASFVAIVIFMIDAISNFFS